MGPEADNIQPTRNRPGSPEANGLSSWAGVPSFEKV